MNLHHLVLGVTAAALTLSPLAAQTRETPAASCKAAPLSSDTAEVAAAIDGLEFVGRAAPNAEAQRALDEITSLMASRGDADSQVAAALMRKHAGGAATASVAPTRPSRCR